MARLVAGQFSLEVRYSFSNFLRNREYHVNVDITPAYRGRPLFSDAIREGGTLCLVSPWACQLIPALDALKPDGVPQYAGYGEPNARITFTACDGLHVMVDLDLHESVFWCDDESGIQGVRLLMEPDWPAVRAFHAELRTEFKAMALDCSLWQIISSDTDPWCQPTPEFLADMDWVRQLVEA